jgi:hypothetical protein
MWHSQLGRVEGEYLLFDFSRVHQLTQIQIWNYNERIYNLHLTRGARRVDIYASNTGKGSPDSSSDQWRLVVKDEIVSVADGTNDYATPHEIALKNVETRFLAIVFRDVHGFDPRYPGDPQKRRVGLSEVRFFGKRVPQ